MKILVTGGLGFIGSNFISKLLKESNEFEVVNVDAESVSYTHLTLPTILLV